jgi:hypothetical protein
MQNMALGRRAGADGVVMRINRSWSFLCIKAVGNCVYVSDRER